MSGTKFLYGAAVQGIQGFIFQTNKLREIVGASELVEEICTTKFEEIVGQKCDKDNPNSILHAAGNIKYIFNSKEECEKVVCIFPKTISEFAPGVMVSQAVVEMEGKYADFKDAVNELEKRLRTQRNKPMRSATLGLMAIERSRQTGFPVTFVKKENRFGNEETIRIDQGTRNKLYADPSGERLKTTKSLCEKAFGISFKDHDDRIAYNIEDINQKNDWIAIIHADGNGLGQVVQTIGTDEKLFKDFSESLDEATKNAAVNAYDSVKGNFDETKFIPIRPIVLGGDDFTVICRADIALDYVTEFIRQFEVESGFVSDYGKLGFKHLTACAGIAYIKSSFPFYYGYELAEVLCSRAKKDAKAALKAGELAKSCLMFHKVQDSFTEDWEAIVQRELTPQPDISFEYGPYYIGNAKMGRWTVEELKDYAKKLDSKDGNAVKSHLRQWMSLLHDNPEMAKQKLLRLKSMTSMISYVDDVTMDSKRKVGEKEVTVYPVYDILTIHTINTQETKEVE